MWNRPFRLGTSLDACQRHGDAVQVIRYPTSDLAPWTDGSECCAVAVTCNLPSPHFRVLPRNASSESLGTKLTLLLREAFPGSMRMWLLIVDLASRFGEVCRVHRQLLIRLACPGCVSLQPTSTGRLLIPLLQLDATHTASGRHTSYGSVPNFPCLWTPTCSLLCGCIYL